MKKSLKEIWSGHKLDLLKISFPFMLCFLYLSGIHKHLIPEEQVVVTEKYQHFEILNHGVEVRDTRTGLIWRRCSIGQYWSPEINSCYGHPQVFFFNQAQLEGYNEKYRPPSLEEIKSLVPDGKAPDSYIFPNLGHKPYWTSTRLTTHTGGRLAWYVNLNNGNEDYIDKDTALHVLPVR